MLVRKYVDRTGSATMLATKRSAGVTPEVNVTSMQARESTLLLEHAADVTRSPKQGYQWPHKGTDVLKI